MKLIPIVALCVFSLGPILLLKKQLPEQGFLLSIGLLTVVLLYTLSGAVPLLQLLSELLEQAGMTTEYLQILLRSVAASLVSRTGADLCKDGGSQALATAVETAGTISILLIASPLLQAVVSLLVEGLS